MALIEVEMIAARFNQLVQLLASAGPIAIGILHGLGPEPADRRVHLESSGGGAVSPRLRYPIWDAHGTLRRDLAARFNGRAGCESKRNRNHDDGDGLDQNIYEHH